MPGSDNFASELTAQHGWHTFLRVQPDNIHNRH
jgi:hypothetical protein